MRDWTSREFTEVAKSNTALFAQGRHLLLKGEKRYVAPSDACNYAVCPKLNQIERLSEQRTLIPILSHSPQTSPHPSLQSPPS